MKRNQGYRQAKNPKANLENIQEGGQHEPSSYNNFVVHNLVNKTSHKTLQLEWIKMFKYLWDYIETPSKQHFKIIEQLMQS